MTSCLFGWMDTTSRYGPSLQVVAITFSFQQRNDVPLCNKSFTLSIFYCRQILHIFCPRMSHLCFSLSNRRTCETAFLILKKQKYVSLRYLENNQAFKAGQKFTETTWNSPFTAAVFSVFGSAFDFCREICNRQH